MLSRWLPLGLAAVLVGHAIGVARSQEPPESLKPAAPQATSVGTKKQKPKRVVSDLSGFDLLEPSQVRKQTTTVGATRGFPPPLALAPRLGKVYGLHPLFAWSYQGKAKDFIFLLRDEAQKEIFRGQVTGGTYRYPQDAPALQPEKTYFWTVEVSSTFPGGSASAPAGFLVVPVGQRAEIEKKLAQIGKGDTVEGGLERARVFTDYRLWYDALDAYSGLIGRVPDRADLYEARGTIYSQLGVTQELAEQDFARADELASKN